MGTYNTLTVEMTCPRCGRQSETQVDCHFGNTREMRSHLVGDTYPWVERNAVQNGGRRAGGDVDGAGYAECPLCGLDYHVTVAVRGDVIVSAAPDLTKAPYLAG